MERHKCKLCFKSFSNGRALGGHMRSHMLNLPIPTKQYEEEEEEQDQEHVLPIQLSQETESASSSSSEEDDGGEEEDDDEDKGGCYGLRENPKRSIRMVDPEFSFGVDAGSVVLQDRESETESSKNPTRRRSKRARKLLEYQYNQENRHHHQQRQELDDKSNAKKFQFVNKFSKSESAEPEPVSSVSDTTTEEDIAFCLMMLSRDKWKRKEQQNQHQKQHQQAFQVQEFEEDEEAEETDESEEYMKTTIKNSKSAKGKYKCETCKKVFKSYQALGGHRASHKKLKLQSQIQGPEFSEVKTENAGTSNSVLAEKKVHECPYCYRVFSSGQALGGHKRSHVIGAAATTATTTSTGAGNARISSKSGDNLSFIDLNLPAPVEDDDLSAVSDAEFVNHNQIKR